MAEATGVPLGSGVEEDTEAGEEGVDEVVVEVDPGGEGVGAGV